MGDLTEPTRYFDHRFERCNPLFHVSTVGDSLPVTYNISCRISQATVLCNPCCCYIIKNSSHYCCPFIKSATRCLVKVNYEFSFCQRNDSFIPITFQHSYANPSVLWHM